jgi:hypothetical protein
LRQGSTRPDAAGKITLGLLDQRQTSVPRVAQSSSHTRDNRRVTAFAIGQYVALYGTHQLDQTPGSRDIADGTRGIVRAIDESRQDDTIYLIGFLASERLTGDELWTSADYLFPA